MRTIRHSGVHEFDVRKSRFICCLERVADEEAARSVIARRRRQHWNAAHNCTAYVLDGGHVQRSSDDGEPSGTAGVPMLEVLRHRGITDTVAVVTRYFGGVKLGAGGLVRAYGSAVSAALDVVGTVELRSMLIVTVLAGYAEAGGLESALHGSGYQVRATRYGSDIEVDVALVPEALDSFSSWLADRTGGRAIYEVRGQQIIECDG
ncbi:YigZ family protein [Lipingzhangella sp. LS1_29]|uniref:YigZ family protein n=1 Tax=Lipingzhangella rawalii TaxID=2055835 RepID=A0ABU2HA62_9ACTN|nr:YigZ family protein [Lipingzhangella rawalii]MDS1271489.1 YigZ family protein [Lipingzhangella rawalii]